MLKFKGTGQSQEMYMYMKNINDSPQVYFQEALYKTICATKKLF